MSELSSQPTSIQTVYGWFQESRLFVNRRYQRKLVWTLEEKQRLIESILKKYPIPAILISEREDAAGEYEIIDGLQRLHTIVSFIENGFSTLEGTHFNLEHFPTAKARADEGAFDAAETDQKLSQREVSTLLDYTLALSVMRNSSEQEVNDVFDRINTYGHRLSDQERRQAGVQHDFANMVRRVACTLRGDSSEEVLPLSQMPSISIDLPMTQHGYEVQADEVFWVAQGILRSTDLRDSMDEQCIADISACVLRGEAVERSRVYLDAVYTQGSTESKQIQNALEVYGVDKFVDEFKFCIDEILKVCSAGDRSTKLRNIIYCTKKQTNPFPNVFAMLAVAFHELIVKDGMVIADYKGLKEDLMDLNERLETTRKSTMPRERKKNIDAIKGLVSDFFVEGDAQEKIYGTSATTDIESAIRRSEIELANFELKQGLLPIVHGERKINESLVSKVIATITAIANNGPNHGGRVIVGVADGADDAQRVRKIDKIEPKTVGRKFVVGINREADVLGLSVEDYVALWRDRIANSELSEPLRGGVLSGLDYNSFFGLGVLVLNVPAQRELSYLGDQVYWRKSDCTELAADARKIAELATRFS